MATEGAEVEIAVEDDGLQALRDQVAELDWPIIFMHVHPDTMSRFQQMTRDIEGGMRAKFEYLMDEAGWGE